MLKSDFALNFCVKCVFFYSVRRLFFFDLIVLCWYFVIIYISNNTWNDSNKYHSIWYTLCILTFIPERNLYYINITNTNTFNLIHYLPIDISDFILKSKLLYVFIGVISLKCGQMGPLPCKDHWNKNIDIKFSVTLFWNNLHQVLSKSKDLKAKQFKVLEAIKPKGLNRIAKIG